MIRIVLGLIILAASALIVNELCGWLELVPRAILRLVAMQLPADLRQGVYEEEWRPELFRHMREAEGRPISRLIVGIKYATDMARGARKVGRELDGVRDKDLAARNVELHDAGAAADLLDVYGTFPPQPGLAGTAANVSTANAGITLSGTGRLGIGEAMTPADED